jgi:hypothetical protein
VRLAEFPLHDVVERDGIRYVSPPILMALKVAALVKRRLPRRAPPTSRI